MSTRAGIIIKDGYDQIHFYKHSDGYPEGTLPLLEKFLNWVKEGKIRKNVIQAAGWLVIIGADAYNTYNGYKCPKCGKTERNGLEKEYRENENEELRGTYCKECNVLVKYVQLKLHAANALKPEGGQYDFTNWKVGAFEPTTKVQKHGDLEYIYTVDLKNLKITYKKV